MISKGFSSGQEKSCVLKMKSEDIRWNDEARNKILADADRVLREAVVALGETMAGQPSDDVYAKLVARLKGRFIDFEPGPDVRKYADAIAAGDFDPEGVDLGEVDIGEIDSNGGESNSGGGESNSGGGESNSGKIGAGGIDGAQM